MQALLPPGFSTDTSGGDAIAITGNNASLDRGMMQDRFDAIGRGEFDPATGEFGAGLRQPGGDGQGRGGPGGFGRGGPAARVVRADAAVRAGRADAAVPVAAPGRARRRRRRLLPRRPRRPAERYSGTANYTFGGSVLDSAPYQLRPDSVAAKNPYAKNTYGGTIGGPVKIRGIYDGTRKTNFVLTFNGNHGNSLFDQLRHRADRGVARRRLLVDSPCSSSIR